MTMKIKTLLMATLLFATTLNCSAEQYPFQKVVYHVNYHDQNRINETLINVSNHLEALSDDNIDIKVMVHGKAVEFLMEAVEDDAKQIQLDALRLRGVQFLVCGNTLNGYNITDEDLYEVETEDVVQAGLPAIVDLQQKGYIYVRP